MNDKFNFEQNFIKVWETPTDPKHLKNVSSNGRNYSAIDSTHQFLQATEIFNGPYGLKWGLKDLDYTFKTLADTELLILKERPRVCCCISISIVCLPCGFELILL